MAKRLSAFVAVVVFSALAQGLHAWDHPSRNYLEKSSNTLGLSCANTEEVQTVKNATKAIRSYFISGSRKN